MLGRWHETDCLPGHQGACEWTRAVTKPGNPPPQWAWRIVQNSSTSVGLGCTKSVMALAVAPMQGREARFVAFAKTPAAAEMGTRGRGPPRPDGQRFLLLAKTGCWPEALSRPAPCGASGITAWHAFPVGATAHSGSFPMLPPQAADPTALSDLKRLLLTGIEDSRRPSHASDRGESTGIAGCLAH